MKTWRNLLKAIGAAPAARRPRRYRPTVEILEDRFVPSGDLTGGYVQINLASDVPGLARVLDPYLVNAWGLSYSPTGPYWIAEAGMGVSDLLDGRGDIVPLVVNIPSTFGGPGIPTGTVFNSGPRFVVSANGVSAAGQFLFATADGTISAWAPAADMDNAIVAVDNSSQGAVYLGLAIATDGNGQTFIYAADNGNGRIDVFDDHFNPVYFRNAFVDPNLPDGFAPFNVQLIDDRLFVTYAPYEDVGYASYGEGLIDVYNIDGTFVERFATGGPLDLPWGVALAPDGFGIYGGALLVGNNGDGRISAFDPLTGDFLGQLTDDNGDPIANPNLWGLSFGNGHMGGDANTLFFAAGYEDDAHGLFGAIQGPLNRGADTAGPLGFDPTFPGERDDYPLPPMAGPNLTPPERNQPSVALLPSSSSSIALAPTLTTFVQPSAGPNVSSSITVAPPTAPVVTVAFVVTVDGNRTSTVGVPPGDGSRSIANDIGANPGSLNAFLDVSPASDDAVRGNEIRTPAVIAMPLDRSQTSDNRLAIEIGLAPLATPFIDSSVMPEAQVFQGVGESAAMAASSDMPAAPAAPAAIAPEQSVRERGRADWLKPLQPFLFLVVISLVLNCTLARRRLPRPASQERQRLEGSCLEDGDTGPPVADAPGSPTKEL